MNDFLLKEDYEEPRCLLNMHPEYKPIPVMRVLEKLDSYLEKNDYDSAERHLKYWVSEAEANNDTRGKLTVLNEQIGLYRKTFKESECFQAVSDALSLIEASDVADNITVGTTLINAATGYKAFGKAEEAIPLYRKARSIYETYLDDNDGRLGGLYNNMALALTDLGQYLEAEELYLKAIDVMKQQENGELETAITCLNIADLINAKVGLVEGEDDIAKNLIQAEKLLNTESIPRNGYYAFVCEKCAPVFGYYGYFFIEKELNKRAREIYERA